jgi:hypothetical protein
MPGNDAEAGVVFVEVVQTSHRYLSTYDAAPHMSLLNDVEARDGEFIE